MFPSVRLTFRLAVSCLTFSATAFCADYQIEANIRYGQYAENVLDIVQSPAPALKNRPGVIVIHGDGAKERTIEQFCVPLVQHDFVVANVEYRSPKSLDAKAAVNDVLEAAHWFHNHAARFKVDPGAGRIHWRFPCVDAGKGAGIRRSWTCNQNLGRDQFLRRYRCCRSIAERLRPSRAPAHLNHPR